MRRKWGWSGSVQLSVSVLFSIQSLMFPEGVCLEAVGRRANPLGNGFYFKTGAWYTAPQSTPLIHAE
jgi:hypothetical protein